MKCERCGDGTSFTALFGDTLMCRACYKRVPEKRRDAEISFLVFGSLLSDQPAIKDIDLFVPEFTDERRFVSFVDLGPYERLSRAAGAPVEVFFGILRPNEPVMIGWYRPPRPWRMCWSVFERVYFPHGLQRMTFAEIVALTKTKTICRKERDR
jgi:hypothetical protein